MEYGHPHYINIIHNKSFILIIRIIHFEHTKGGQPFPLILLWFVCVTRHILPSQFCLLSPEWNERKKNTIFHQTLESLNQLFPYYLKQPNDSLPPILRHHNNDMK